MTTSTRAQTRSIWPWLGLFAGLLTTHLGLYAFSAQTFSAGGALLAGTLALLATALARGLTLFLLEKPLAGAVAGIERARQSGDLTFRLEPAGYGALPRLADSYNQLVNEFSAAMAKMLFTSQRLQETCSDLGKGAERVAGSAEQQCEASRAASGDVGNMKQSMAEATRAAAGTVDDATRSRELSQQGAQVVSRVADEMGRVAGSVSESARQIELLGQRSEEIGSVVQVIREIADQTNLLALNAAIEAACPARGLEEAFGLGRVAQPAGARRRLEEGGEIVGPGAEDRAVVREGARPLSLLEPEVSGEPVGPGERGVEGGGAVVERARVVDPAARQGDGAEGGDGHGESRRELGRGAEGLVGLVKATL